MRRVIRSIKVQKKFLCLVTDTNTNFFSVGKNAKLEIDLTVPKRYIAQLN